MANNILTPQSENIIFREIDGMWRRVDSQEPQPPTLAEYIERLCITIDENTQFSRIIRYYGRIKQTIEYRAYSGKVRISIRYARYK